MWLRFQRALPDAPVFRIGYWTATDTLQHALKAVKWADYRSHDWRHTYAVQALRDGESPQAVAHQLGHKTAAMVHAVYGRYVPIASDYRSGQTVGPTVASEGASKVDKTRAAG
jgi:integrase